MFTKPKIIFFSVVAVGIGIAAFIFFTSNRYLWMSNKKIAKKFESKVVEEYIEVCNESLNSFYGSDGQQYHAKGGNGNWWSPIGINDPENQFAVFVAEDRAFGAIQEINKVPVLTTGLKLFSTHAGDSIYNDVDFNTGVIDSLIDGNSKTTSKTVLHINSSMMKSYYDAKVPEHNLEFVSYDKNTESISDVSFDFVYAYNPSDDELDDLLDAEVPMLVFYNDWWANSGSIEKLNLTVNYPGSKDLLELSPSETCKQSSYYQTVSNISEVLYMINDGTLTTNITKDNVGTICPISVGKASCDFNKITVGDGEKTINELFFQPLSYLTTRIKNYDADNVDIYETDNNLYLKYALAFAHNLREEIEYHDMYFRDMENHTKFFASIFADRIINYSTPDNELQNDLGEFSPEEDKVQELKVKKNVTVSKPVTQYDNWFATGIYLKAGQTAKIYRKDSMDVDVKLMINFQRDGASRIFDGSKTDLDENSIIDGKYTRPYTDRSYVVNLNAGSEVVLNTPKGGPLYIFVPRNEEFGKIEIEADKVLQSPYIESFDEDSVSSFADHVFSTPINWVDIATNEVQVHTERTGFVKGLTKNGDFEDNLIELIQNTNDYTIGVTYNYAGILGENPVLKHSDNVKSFCTTFGISEECEDKEINRRAVQHVNADRAACGGLCAGNPYDSYGNFTAIGFGDNHEIGHNLQTGKLKIYSGRSTEVSNNIFPTEVNRIYAKNNGMTNYNARYSGEHLFKYLKKYYNTSVGSTFTLYASEADTNPDNDSDTSTVKFSIQKPSRSDWSNYSDKSVAHPLWENSSYAADGHDRLTFYHNIRMLTNDYEVFTKMYLHIRAVNSLTESEFDSKKNQLGFSEYSFADYKSISGNDYMAIMASKMANTDASEFFLGFGIFISDEAKAQIASESYGSTKPAGVYKMLNLDGSYLPVDFLNSSNYVYRTFSQNW